MKKVGSPEQAKNMKILVIDDDQGILDAMDAVLKLEGYEVMTATGPEIVPNIPKLKPNLIILDVLLSGADGREIAAKLKKSAATRKIPIILFSANQNMEKQFEGSGADAFLEKPFEVKTLYKMVRELAH